MLDLATIRDHLVVEHTDDDLLIQQYYKAALAACEGIISGAIDATKQRVVYREGFPAGTLPMVIAPRALTIVDIQYGDEDFAEQTVPTGDYAYVRNGLSGWAYRLTTDSWPPSNWVKITYTGGFAVVPDDINQAILLSIGHYYENRESVSPINMYEVPQAVPQILMPYRVLKI